MNKRRIAIGSDHRGFALKEYLQQHIDATWRDVGCNSAQACDYPLYVPPVCTAVRAGEVDYGILLCGSGVGMAIAANRFVGIYAALVWSPETARLSKEHDNANILVLPADFITDTDAVLCVQAWLGATFLGGRHQRRLEEIDALCGVRSTLQ